MIRRPADPRVNLQTALIDAQRLIDFRKIDNPTAIFQVESFVRVFEEPNAYFRFDDSLGTMCCVAVSHEARDVRVVDLHPATAQVALLPVFKEAMLAAAQDTAALDYRVWAAFPKRSGGNSSYGRMKALTWRNVFLGATVDITSDPNFAIISLPTFRQAVEAVRQWAI